MQQLPYLATSPPPLTVVCKVCIIMNTTALQPCHGLVPHPGHQVTLLHAHPVHAQGHLPHPGQAGVHQGAGCREQDQEQHLHHQQHGEGGQVQDEEHLALSDSPHIAQCGGYQQNRGGTKEDSAKICEKVLTELEQDLLLCDLLHGQVLAGEDEGDEVLHV